MEYRNSMLRHSCFKAPISPRQKVECFLHAREVLRRPNHDSVFAWCLHGQLIAGIPFAKYLKRMVDALGLEPRTR